MSRFVLSITDTATGSQAQLRPGGTSERQIINEVVNAVIAKGVGLFKTEAHVAQAVREALIEVLTAVKSDVQPPSR